MSQRESISARTRFSIFHRDGFRCCYCGVHAGQSELVIDHVFPVSRGGGNHPSNLRTACVKCNSGKSDQFQIESIPGAKYPYSEEAARQIALVSCAYDFFVEHKLGYSFAEMFEETQPTDGEWEDWLTEDRFFPEDEGGLA